MWLLPLICRVPKKKVKNKFEEDIIEPFASNFSLSATFETKDEPDIESFGELTSIFPGLSVLNIDAGMILSKVNNFEAREFSCQLGKVEFGTEGSTHDMSLEFWYLPGEAKNESPIIVEFTFDYDAAEPGSLDNSKKGSLLEEFPISVVSKANAFYHLMQEIKYFRGSQTAKTKTQFAYDCARNI